MLNAVIRQALISGYLEKDVNNYGVLKVTDKGHDFIKKPQSFEITEDSDGDSGSLVLMALVGMVLFPFVAFVCLSGKEKDFKWGCLSLAGIPLVVFVLFKSCTGW